MKRIFFCDWNTPNMLIWFPRVSKNLKLKTVRDFNQLACFATKQWMWKSSSELFFCPSQHTLFHFLHRSKYPSQLQPLARKPQCATPMQKSKSSPFPSCRCQWWTPKEKLGCQSSFSRPWQIQFKKCALKVLRKVLLWTWSSLRKITAAPLVKPAQHEIKKHGR